MAMAEASGTRRDAIVAAITAELDRQAREGVARVDVNALAEAVDMACENHAPPDEGRRPEDLNATNDD